MATKKTRKQAKNDLGKYIIIFIVSTLFLVGLFYIQNVTTWALLKLLWALIIVMVSFPNFLSLLFIIQEMYNYTPKSKRIVEENLSSEFKTIYVNTDCLKKSALPLHTQRTYKAKLEDDGRITLRIENEHDDTDFLEETVTDYSWFLSLFRFSE